MEAKQAPLIKLLDGRTQFVIPIYQRTYSWKIIHCQQLLDDIQRVGNDHSAPSHFIGSIVYFKPNESPNTAISQSVVIDGQQRLTTVSLLLLALVRFLKERQDIKLEDESWEAVQETYLINRHRKDDSQFKLLLTKRDKDTFIKLIQEHETASDDSERIVENYQHFLKCITAENFQSIYRGIKNLIIVDVVLERDKDNPQLIFESLNSTGRALSQADLIRNYVLMRQLPDAQKTLYEKYWYPMEKNFGTRIDKLALFIRDYLTMKQASIPNINRVYEVYKQFLKEEKCSTEDALRSLHRYSKFYVRIAWPTEHEQDADIVHKLQEISTLKIEPSRPFLLAVYGDYENGQIDKTDFVDIIGLVCSYVFRRAICGIPTNSLNNNFAALYKQIKRANYLESVKAAFLLMDSYRRFPTDAEFIKEIQAKNVYHFRSTRYLLESLENRGRKEPIHANNYTVEHILPQNENISPKWQEELGKEWEAVKNEYLHTLGNLSLTGYNSELSDSSFKKKKNIEPGGFNGSPLFLNQSVKEASVWNKEAICKRALILAERACVVWHRPSLSPERLDRYRTPKDILYNIESYEYLQGNMLKLYTALEKQILNLDAFARVEFKKFWIAFKAGTNFVNVIPLKEELKLFLNINFDDLEDPAGICRDVSGIGKWGTGDAEVKLKHIDQIDYIMKLINQALDNALE